MCSGGNSAKITIQNSTFTKCTIAGMKASDHSIFTSSGNKFKDIGENVMMISHEGSVITSSNDLFEGRGLAAIAAFGQGEVIVHNGKVNNVLNTAVLSYQSGKISIEGCVINGCRNPAIQARERSHLILHNVEVNKSESGGFLISDSFGEMVNCKATECTKIGLELGDMGSDFKIIKCQFNNQKLIGLSCHNKVEVTFQDCAFNGNEAIGIDVNGLPCKPIFYNCEFNNNGEAGINCVHESSATFNNCRINNNSKIGLGSNGANPIVNNSSISENGQSGLSIYGSSRAVFNSCTFDHNKKFAGQIHMKGTHCKLTDCKVINHSELLDFLVSNDATLRCVNSQFDNSNRHHFEVK